MIIPESGLLFWATLYSLSRLKIVSTANVIKLPVIRPETLCNAEVDEYVDDGISSSSAV